MVILSGGFLAQGCMEGPSGGKVTFAPASGTVTINGSPLSGARVSAYPETGPVAMGVTDDMGKFTLTTGSNEGAAVGKIGVAVTVPTAGGSGPVTVDMTDVTAAMQAHAEQNRPQPGRPAGGSSAAGANAASKSVISTQYADPKTSGLSFEIKEGQDNVLTIDLK
jgi:hypothetical protein